MQDLEVRYRSSRLLFFALLVITLAFRILFEINNPVLTSDNAIQLSAAKNYLQLGTLSISKVEASNLSEIISEPLKMWPVGFSLCVFLLYKITNDILQAAILFQCIGAVLLVLGMLRTLKLLNVSHKTQLLFLLMFTFNSSPFFYSGSTDLFTVAIFIWIVNLVIDVSKTERIKPVTILFIAFLSFFTAAIRFACIPNLAIIPFFFLLLFLLKKEGKYLLTSSLVLVTSGIFTYFFYKQFPMAEGRTDFMDNLKNGVFYFSHLKWFDPFPIKALFYTRPIEFRLPHDPTILFLYRSATLLLAMLFVGLLISIIIKRFRVSDWLMRFRDRKEDDSDNLMLIFISTSAVIISFIALQSVTVGPESNSFGPSWMPPIWTFVYSTRYFIYIMILLVILFFIGYDRASTNRKLVFVFRSIYGTAFVWAILNWMFLNYQFYSVSGNGAASEWVNEKNEIAAYKAINSIYSSESKPSIVYAHFKDKVKQGLVTNYAFAHTSDDYNKIISGEYKTTAPLILLLMMPSDLSDDEKKFLERNTHSVVAKFDKEQLIRINLS